MNKVVTIGLGYIGLPTSALIANSGIKVHGVDINKSIVETINKGKIHIIEPDLDVAVKNAVDSGFLSASVKCIEADVYLIVVPTPFKENNEPHSLKSIMIDKPSRYVLEMNGESKKRFNLKEGDKINFIEKSKIKFKYF